MLIVNLLLLFLVSHFSREKLERFPLISFPHATTTSHYAISFTIADIFPSAIVYEIYLISTIQQINCVKFKSHKIFAGGFVRKITYLSTQDSEKTFQIKLIQCFSSFCLRAFQIWQYFKGKTFRLRRV